MPTLDDELVIRAEPQYIQAQIRTRHTTVSAGQRLTKPCSSHRGVGRYLFMQVLALWIGIIAGIVGILQALLSAAQHFRRTRSSDKTDKMPDVVTDRPPASAPPRPSIQRPITPEPWTDRGTLEGASDSRPEDARAQTNANLEKARQATRALVRYGDGSDETAMSFMVWLGLAIAGYVAALIYAFTQGQSWPIDVSTTGGWLNSKAKPGASGIAVAYLAILGVFIAAVVIQGGRILRNERSSLLMMVGFWLSLAVLIISSTGIKQ
jgi:hypothetical protein